MPEVSGIPKANLAEEEIVTTARVDVAPVMLAWARDRSGIPTEDLVRKFPKLSEWEAGTRLPTFRQLEQYSNYTHTPLGYLYLATPPAEPLPVPDFRTRGDRGVGRPSADLLDVIYACQQRQQWYSEYARYEGFDPPNFLASATLATPIEQAAETMREVLGFDLDARRGYRTWDEAFSGLSRKAETIGCLVMTSGIVGSNTHRRLDPAEFGAFALAQTYAPLVFINGRDTRAAMIFSLAHELAHLWLGESGLDIPDPTTSRNGTSERWCNAVAAEFLVPGDSLRAEHLAGATLRDELDRLAKLYKVSTLVVLSRLHDVAALGWDDYRRAWDAEVAYVKGRQELLTPRKSGGDFYNTLPVRVSKTFARALVSSTLEGRTSYRDAFELLGFRSVSTFQTLGRELGVSA